MGVRASALLNSLNGAVTVMSSSVFLIQPKLPTYDALTRWLQLAP